ncbi:putative RNA-directed DNA polymerase from transposon BS [Rhizoctonia solani]|uniref:Putative RNA-directed DNA polymerase from transposon BS n=1 Tax=Rhizoctonia solani TaxID=456999 RepID=A0A0K6GFC3_9AGAM|nr:putative RNA-directed DNA polymerase from transposon BS [Rhizoctonia solani]
MPTLQSTASKNYTRPDNVFVSRQLVQALVSCQTVPDAQPMHTDHLPIRTSFELTVDKPLSCERWDWRKGDWEKFNEALELELADLPGLRLVTTQEALDERVAGIDRAIWKAVKQAVPTLRITPYSKRWWTPELSKLRRKVRKLARRSYNLREFGDLEIHKRLRLERNSYTQAVREAKRRHWETFLAELEGDQVWTAGKYLSAEPTDGARNEDKSRALLECFFPAPATDLPDFAFSDPASHAAPDLKPLTQADIHSVIQGLRPFKAPGPDRLPACVYKYGANLLVPHLLPVFRASLRLGIYPVEWRKSCTVVLRKPGKPDYSVPKAYRPIALLNVVSKILSACVAERLTRLADKHGWFPAHHFGGRASCNTTVAIHTAVKAIKDAWARGQVVSGLFLDVKGAFPHADPRRLAANMRRIGVPEPYVTWTLTKLDGRVTTLTFDDYTSPELAILNGIDQCCPLSVFYYLTYNSPLIRIP